MMLTSPLERLRQADLPRAMRMALVAVEIVVDFGIAQRAEPAVLLVEIEVAETAAREGFPRELAVVAVIIDEPSEIIEEHEALVFRKLRRVDLEAGDVALVRTRHTLLKAADARAAARADLFRRHDIALRVLPVHPQADDPVRGQAILIVEAGLDEVELLVAAVAIGVELVLIAVDVARITEAPGEEIRGTTQDIRVGDGGRRDLEVGRGR